MVEQPDFILLDPALYLFMRLNIAILIILIVWISCTFNSNGDILKIGIEGNIGNFAPAHSQTFNQIFIKNQIYETLLRLDEHNQIKSNLVKTWSVDTDLKSFHFQLKSGILFHDRSILTTEHINHSIKEYLHYNNSLFTKLYESIDIYDSLNFTIRIKTPSSLFLYLLASPFYLLINKKPLETDKSILSKYIGTGPYYPKYSKQKNIILFQYFHDYWQSSRLAMQKFEIFHNLKYEEAETELIQNNIDILYTIAGYKIDRLKWQGKIEYAVQIPRNIVFIGFNNLSPKFRDREFRKLFSDILEKYKLVVNINRGNAINASGPLPPIYDIFTEGNSINRDKNSSVQIENTELPSYSEVNFFFPKIAFARKTIVKYLENQYKKIDVNLRVYEFDNWSEHDAAVKSDSAELFIDTYGAEILGDPANFLFSLFHSQSEKNSLRYFNPRVDQLLDEAIREPDEAKRRAKYETILHIIDKDVPAIFLSHVKPHFAFRTEKIKNLVVNPYGIIQFHQTILN